MAALVARMLLRILQYFGMKNVYVRRSLWVVAIVRWVLRRRRGSAQTIRLRQNENLVVTINKNEARVS